MNVRRQMVTFAFGRQVVALLFVAVWSQGALGQVVTPKTIPVMQGDQFDIFPSSRWGMAGTGIALDDTLNDPFVNPAKARRLGGSGLFALPYFHSISGNRGGGKSVPLGGYWSAGQWSGAVVGVIQQLDRALRAPTFGFECCTPVSERSANNEYLAGSLARDVGRGVTLGGALSYGGLGAMDGVDLLYAGADTIHQDGSLTSLRLGLTKDWSKGRTFELLVLHNRASMSHDVHFTTTRFDPQLNRLVFTERWDHEKDRTHIWGLHTEYVRPIGAEGWRVGWLATANRLSHPKIPNYVLQNIPRDPGTTYAYNVGFGVGRLVGPLSFGVDLILEPMTAETWADLPRDTTGTGGRVIRAGQRTIENSFRFANRKLRLGVSRDVKLANDSSSSVGIQFGLGVHSINYTLRQTNNIASTFRRQKESWMEWSPSFALSYRARDYTFQYGVRLACATSGACLPDFGGGGDFTSVAAPDAIGLAGGGIIAAPSAPLTFDSGSSVVHRFAIVIPIR